MEEWLKDQGMFLNPFDLHLRGTLGEEAVCGLVPAEVYLAVIKAAL